MRGRSGAVRFIGSIVENLLKELKQLESNEHAGCRTRMHGSASKHCRIECPNIRFTTLCWQ